MSIKIVSAANAMKGSLSAQMASNAMASGAREAVMLFNDVFAKNIKADIIVRPIADGGDDTLDVIAEKFYNSTVTGPLGDKINAKWGSRGQTAIIELAKASGIALVNPNDLNPFKTTTFGTGELINEALKHGFKKMLLTIGGSATVDGGIGALSALGAKFYNENNDIIHPFGNTAVGKVKRINMDSLKELAKEIEITFACDVENPLLGPNGASFVFGPQKLSPKIRNDQILRQDALVKMDMNLKQFSTILKDQLGVDPSIMKGSGAAGGFPIGFTTAMGAKLKKGADLVLDILQFDTLKDADIVLTSEGRFDSQTLCGKAPFALTKRMMKSQVIILAGSIESPEVEKNILKEGASLIAPISDAPLSLEECMNRTNELMHNCAMRNVFAYLKTKFK